MLPKPVIITRTQWGAARPKACDTYGPAGTDLSRFYQRITIHHTADVTKAGATDSQAKKRIREIQAFHQDSNRWCDLGYHYLIDPDGRIFSGRSMFSPGAHVEGQNYGNLGISLLGNFESQLPTALAWSSLEALTSWAAAYLDVDPLSIHGHRDFNATACPGRNLYRRLPELREEVRLRITGQEPVNGGTGAPASPKFPGEVTIKRTSSNQVCPLCSTHPHRPGCWFDTWEAGRPQ